jgi:hypothetical protein
MTKPNCFTAILACLIFMMSLSCRSNTKQEGKEDSTPAATPGYPALNNEQHSQLYSTADQVDIIVYHLPISVNQDDVSSVRNTILYISPESPDMTQKCNPLGRLSWMAKGVIIREADIFIGPGCQYLLFIENGKPVAANVMAPAGVEFFQNIIRQVEQRTQ